MNNKVSLNIRISRTMTIFNLTILIVLLLILSIFLGYSLNRFSYFISESISNQMSGALTYNKGMEAKFLGEPYVLSGLKGKNTSKENEDFNLIHYKVYSKDKVIYDSVEGKEASYRLLDKLNINRYINYKSSENYYNSKKEVIGKVEVELNPLVIYYAFIILIVGCSISFFVIFLLSQSFVKTLSKSIVKPLSDLNKKMSEIGQGDIEAAIHTDINFEKPFLEVEMLSNNASKIIRKMQSYITEIEESRKSLKEKILKINSIFNEIEQGIFQIDDTLKIDQEYSNSCKVIFGKNIENLTLEVILFENDEIQKVFVSELISKIFEEESNIDLYISLLPTECNIEKKYINLQYKLIYNENNSKILLVTVTDISEKIYLENEMLVKQKTLKMVVNSMIHPNILRQLINSYIEFANDIRKYIVNGEIEFLKREIHTFKGNFSQFDFYKMALFLEDIENDLSNDINNIHSNQFETDKFLNPIYKDLELIKTYTGRDFLSESLQFSIEQEKIIKIEDDIKLLLSEKEYKKIINLIRELRYMNLSHLLSHFPEYVQKLGERLGKPIEEFEIEGDDLKVDPSRFENLIRSMVHIFRNIVDHGIEDPDERVEKNKSIMGKIRCSVVDEEDIRIIITDDGRGIDLENLKKSVVNKELKTKEELKNMNENEILNLIFLDGISTKEDITSISGRGVGLAALKKDVEDMNGIIKVKSIKDVGSEFEIVIPKEKGDFEFVNIEDFIKNISDNTRKLIFDEYGFEIEEEKEIIESKIELNDMTALVSLKWNFNSIVIISLNQKLLDELTKKMILYPIEVDEIDEYRKHVLSEITNIIVGNSLNIFDNTDKIMEFGTPGILTNSKGYIKYFYDCIYSTYYKSKEFEINVHVLSIK